MSGRADEKAGAELLGKPRHESVKNGAGVACIPEIRAALRLKAFEARPDANLRFQ